MTGPSLLVLVAAVVGVEADRGRIDRGLWHGLAAGDLGRVYYELTVGSEVRRIEVGTATVVALELSEAVVEAQAGSRLMPGFSVEFRLPAERLDPERQATLLVESAEGGDRLDELLQRLLPDDPSAEARLLELLEARRERRRGDGASSEAKRKAVEMLQIPAGRHQVGVDSSGASFYNQQPRFTVDLGAFWIDSEPMRAERFEPMTSGRQNPDDAWATDVTFADASARCRRLGKRLPTELEWEVAATRFPELIRPLYEWTASWYLPYPGNDRLEREYGEQFRVLRGHPDPAQIDPRERRFLAPGARRSDVGFRCVRD